jgi:diacylglycerol O-acyltransferase
MEVPMEERRALGVQDALWLEMDRPNNLMVVDSVIWTAEPLDWDQVRKIVDERLTSRYPVFRSRAVKDRDGSWWWEVDEDFDFDTHITIVELNDPDDRGELQRLVAAHRTTMLDRSRPLWEAIWVDRYLGGSAMVLRTHHAIADGMRMVELAMSLFDASPEGGALADVARNFTRPAAPTPTGPPLADRVRSGVRALASRVPTAAADARSVTSTSLRNPVGAGHTLVTSAWAAYTQLLASIRSTLFAALPRRGALIDVFSAAPGDVDALRKYLLGVRNDSAIWTGVAGDEKGVAWSEPLPLDDVKSVARASRCTVNEVLVACTAGALHDYLQAHETRCASVTFMVPVNLKPLDLTLPDDLGNGFALVQLELPTDQPDIRQVLTVAKRRMDRIKRGHEAAIAFRIQDVIANFNRSLYEASVDLFTTRTIGTLTNVPGPPVPVYLAGSRVEGMVGWAPVSGNQPMSFTIYSYDGKVIVGIACDRHLVPDHEFVVERFGAAFARLKAATTLG